jgi:hypothetical protein
VGYRGISVTINEATTLVTTTNAFAGFYGVISEAFNITDSQSSQVDFYATQAENVLIIDQVCVYGWTNVDDFQDANWSGTALVIETYADFAGFAFGGLPFAGYLKTTTTNKENPGVTPVVNWQGIGTIQTASWSAIVTPTGTTWTQVNTAQTPTWNTIDTTQKCEV